MYELLLRQFNACFQVHHAFRTEDSSQELVVFVEHSGIVRWVQLWQQSIFKNPSLHVNLPLLEDLVQDCLISILLLVHLIVIQFEVGNSQQSFQELGVVHAISQVESVWDGHSDQFMQTL